MSRWPEPCDSVTPGGPAWPAQGEATSGAGNKDAQTGGRLPTHHQPCAGSLPSTRGVCRGTGGHGGPAAEVSSKGRNTVQEGTAATENCVPPKEACAHLPCSPGRTLLVAAPGLSTSQPPLPASQVQSTSKLPLLRPNPPSASKAPASPAPPHAWASHLVPSHLVPSHLPHSTKQAPHTDPQLYFQVWLLATQEGAASKKARSPPPSLLPGPAHALPGGVRPQEDPQAS